MRKLAAKKDVLFFPSFEKKLLTIGNEGGSWTFLPEVLDQNSIVYSVGIGNDISFDLDMIKKFSVNIYAYDPTPKCIEWLSKQHYPLNFKFFPFGLSSFDGELNFNLPDNSNFVSASSVVLAHNKNYFSAKVKRLETFMKENGHNHIDILKIDIEGSEYDVIDDILRTGIHIGQFLVEFHHRFKEIGPEKTIEAINKLKNAGYTLIHVNQKTGEEYTFLRTN